ncbi:NDP-sugar pyrophosphorylase family protein [Bradyrhizobium sp. CIR18]|nr:NDP-sugar pyrophosphorylase family protein [Bradyrhizobium sp. CIR18]
MEVNSESCNPRRWPWETHLRPKPTIDIGEMPLLWHILKGYFHHGINDFIICCGYQGIC